MVWSVVFAKEQKRAREFVGDVRDSRMSETKRKRQRRREI